MDLSTASTKRHPFYCEELCPTVSRLDFLDVCVVVNFSWSTLSGRREYQIQFLTSMTKSLRQLVLCRDRLLSG